MTKRVELNVTGASTVGIGEQCQSLPFGDGLACTGTDVNQLHFTGKQHDTESGNDYFLARYYASGMAARFLTPDWSKNPQGVPYANYADPQSLDLYSYMLDNPLGGVDPDGHLGANNGASCGGGGGSDGGPCLTQSQQEQATNFKKEDAKSLAGSLVLRQPAPTNPDGFPQAPPIVDNKGQTIVPGVDEWKQVAPSGTGDRNTKWAPSIPVPADKSKKEGQPNASWDPVVIGT